MRKKPFEDIVGKGKDHTYPNCFFSQNFFLPFLKQFSKYESHLFCHLQVLSN